MLSIGAFRPFLLHVVADASDSFNHNCSHTRPAKRAGPPAGKQALGPLPANATAHRKAAQELMLSIAAIPGRKKVIITESPMPGGNGTVTKHCFDMDGEYLTSQKPGHLFSVLVDDCFKAKLGGVVIVRTFTDQPEPATNKGIQRVRSYMIIVGKVAQLPAISVRHSQNATGEGNEFAVITEGPAGEPECVFAFRS
jgi:hypothetical protein